MSEDAARTTYPFPWPERLVDRLPPPERDGLRRLDVLVGGRWDGVLLVDGENRCIGVQVRGEADEYPLPFAPEEIEDARSAARLNRLVTAYPYDPYGSGQIGVVFVSPVFLGLGMALHPAIALGSLLVCAVAIWAMYLAPGFPFLRLLFAITGLSQMLVAILVLVGVVT